MKKILGCCLAVLLVIPLAFGTAFGASAKATAGVDKLVSVAMSSGSVDVTSGASVNSLPWTTIFDQEIHVANQKDLVVGVSLETGLYTRTKVRTSGGAVDQESADAGIKVRVLVQDQDGNQWYAQPDHGALLYGVETEEPGAENETGAGVTFDRRYQQLSAKLQGILNCPAGSAIPDGCTLTDEEIELVLSTLSAHSFNFVAKDLRSGIWNVIVQATALTSPGTDDSEAVAYIGAGTVTVEEVRFVKEVNGVPEPVQF